MDPTPLLATKFFVPHLEPGWVERAQLVQRLNESQTGRLVLLSAPPGYGKTSLLCAWAAQNDYPPAWISLDEGDNDLSRFLAYLNAAVQARIFSADKPPPDSIQLPSLAAVQHILTILVNAITANTERFAIVLDDYHLITNPDIHRALTFLFDHLPPQLTIFMATRQDPNLPLASMRAKGQLFEFRSDDLQFSLEETRAFLTQNLSFNLTEEQIQTLQTKTEGWVTGLRLIALLLGKTNDVPGLIDSFSGSTRQIADYLTEEVLQKQSPELQNFLLQTAILDRLSGPLCDAVTQQTDSQQTLDFLCDNNLFLSALDQERAWYRYHGLFADLLRARSERTSPSLIQELHQRASTWFSLQGFFDQAISHALAARDPQGAAALLDRHAEALWSRGEFMTLLKWAEALPEESLAGRLELTIYHAVALAMTGNVQEGARRLEALDERVSGHTPDAASGLIFAGHTYLAYHKRNVPAMIHYANQALTYLPQDNHLWRGGISVVLGNAHTHRGNIAAAKEVFEKALRLGQSTNNDLLTLTASIHYAISNINQGNLYQAVEICRQQLSREHLRQLPAFGTLSAVWGDVLREWNQLEEAERRIQLGYELSQRGRGVAMWGWSNLAMAKLFFSKGAHDALERALQDLETLVYQSEAPAWIKPSLTSWKIRSLLARGDLSDAIKHFEEAKRNLNDEPSFLQLDLFIASARVDLARGTFYDDPLAISSATALLQGLKTLTEDNGWFKKHLQVLILLSQAFHLQKEEKKTMATLNQALTLAELQGYIRLFLDEGEPMPTLLRQAEGRKDISSYVRKICAAARIETGLEKKPPSPLSKRELEILSLMSQGLSNAEIAELLYITTGTVKVHASHIYQKLGVKGRMQAVNWAQELGLL